MEKQGFPWVDGRLFDVTVLPDQNQARLHVHIFAAADNMDGEIRLRMRRIGPTSDLTNEVEVAFNIDGKMLGFNRYES